MTRKWKNYIEVRATKKECQNCGYKKCEAALDVHHIDGNKNNNSLDNLIILCSNCHRELHQGLLDISEIVSIKNSIPDGVRIKKTGVEIGCYHCGYIWLYSGSSSYYITCPRCLCKLNIRNLNNSKLITTTTFLGKINNV